MRWYEQKDHQPKVALGKVGKPHKKVFYQYLAFLIDTTFKVDNAELRRTAPGAKVSCRNFSYAPPPPPPQHGKKTTFLNYLIVLVLKVKFSK